MRRRTNVLRKPTSTCRDPSYTPEGSWLIPVILICSVQRVVVTGTPQLHALPYICQKEWLQVNYSKGQSIILGRCLSTSSWLTSNNSIQQVKSFCFLGV